MWLWWNGNQSRVRSTFLAYVSWNRLQLRVITLNRRIHPFVILCVCVVIPLDLHVSETTPHHWPLPVVPLLFVVCCRGGGLVNTSTFDYTRHRTAAWRPQARMRRGSWEGQMTRSMEMFVVCILNCYFAAWGFELLSWIVQVCLLRRPVSVGWCSEITTVWVWC